MRTLARVSAMLVLATSLACGGTPRIDSKAEEQALRAQLTNWQGYLTAQNDSAIAALYADDAVLMPSAMPRITGRENIRQFWAQLWAFKATLTITPVNVHVAQAGDWAIEEGDWTLSSPSPAGEQRDNGKYLVTWTRTADGWRVAYDIWNSDLTPPGQAAPASGA